MTAGGVVSSPSRAMSFRASPPSSRSPSPGSSCSDDDDEILRVIRAEIARDDASRRARHQSASASATVVQRGRAPLAASRVQPARRAPAPPRVPMVPPVRDAGRSSNSTSGTLPHRDVLLEDILLEDILLDDTLLRSSRSSSRPVLARVFDSGARRARGGACRRRRVSSARPRPPLSGSRRRVAPRLKRRRRVGTARTFARKYHTRG